MRILLVGCVDFSRHCLQQILAQGGNVVGVITLDDELSGFNADFVRMDEYCAGVGIDCFKVRDINSDESMTLIKDLAPDVIFVFGWSRLIKKPLLDLPPLGCIGTHPALLPRNRGRHPLIWALVEGLEESGLTFFYMDEGADSGDILWQRPFTIDLQDDAGTLYGKMKALASESIAEFLPLLSSGKAPRLPQDHSLANYWRKRSEQDGEIQWTASSMQIYNLVRALTHPYVGAHTFVNGRRLLVWKTALPATPLPTEAGRLSAGTVFRLPQNRIAVRTGDSYLEVRDIQTVDPGDLKQGTILGAHV